MTYNRRIVYRVIATEWPETQVDVIRLFNVIKKNRKTQTRQPRFAV